jgi:hypothetical protein
MTANNETNPTKATNPAKRPPPQSALALPTRESEYFHVQTKYGASDGGESWQVRLLSFLNSSGVQHFLIGLLMLDVFILFVELALDAFFPSCSHVERDAISCCPGDSEAEAHHFFRYSKVLLHMEPKVVMHMAMHMRWS